MPEDKKDDPAFLYFPSNYRWSMGLLICLSAAPWTGVEIDEVNRVGRALADQVGNDTSLVRGMDAYGRKSRVARPRRPACRSQTDRRVLLHACDTLLSDRRTIFASAFTAEHGCLCAFSDAFQGSGGVDPPPTYRAGRDSLREHKLAGAAGASKPRGRGCAAGGGNGIFRRFRRHQRAAIRLWHSRSRRARHRLSYRRRAGQWRERAVS